MPTPKIAYRGHKAEEALSLLTACYNSNNRFCKDLNSLIKEYITLLNAVGNSDFWPNGMNPTGVRWGSLSAWWGEFVAPDRWVEAEYISEEIAIQLKFTAKKAEEIAERWGLRATWGPALVLSSAVLSSSLNKVLLLYLPGYRYPQRKIELHNLWQTLGISNMSHQTPNLSVDARTILIATQFDPNQETKADFMKRMRQEIQKQMVEVIGALQYSGIGAPGGKSSVDTHIQWLYERIALKRPPLHIASNWSKQHPNDDVGQDAVEKALRELYKLLNIKPPRNRGPSIRRL